MSARLLAVALCQAALASEIHVDLQLLTDFSADYDFDDRNLISMGMHNLPVEHEHGHIKVNVAKERFQVKANGVMNIPARIAQREHLPPGPIIGHGEFRFNGPAGFASIRGNMHTGRFAGEYCLKFNVPPGMVPPIREVDAKEQQIAQAMAHAPHTDMQVDGESVAIFQTPGQPGVFGYKHNGVPVGADMTPPQNGAWTPALKFQNWVQGAGDVHEFDCHSTTSASELLSNPGGMEMLARMDRVVGAFAALEPLRQATSQLPAMPSMLVRMQAQEELAQRAPMGAGPAAAALAGGLAGALVAFAALRRGRREQLRETLISDDA